MATQRPSLLTPNANPHEVLCRHFNVSRPTLPSTFTLDADLPLTIDVPLLSPAASHPRTHLPTHVLAVYPSSPSRTPGPPHPPLLLPINASLFISALRVELPAPSSADESAPATGSLHTLTLPLLPLPVPHPPTLPLLLLFALTLEPPAHLYTALAYRLLPPAVVEEFPNAAAMAAVLSRAGSAREGFAEVVRRNEGLWKNVLALGVREGRVQDLVGMVWGVTAEARRIRARAAAAAAAAGGG